MNDHEYKKYCFAKFVWKQPDTATPSGKTTWRKRFEEMYGQTLEDYRQTEECQRYRERDEEYIDWKGAQFRAEPDSPSYQDGTTAVRWAR